MLPGRVGLLLDKFRFLSRVGVLARSPAVSLAPQQWPFISPAFANRRTPHLLFITHPLLIITPIAQHASKNGPGRVSSMRTQS